MIVFDEIKFYTNLQLAGIAGSLLICCIGMKFLTMKSKMLHAEKKEAKLRLREESKKQVLAVNDNE